MNVPNDRRYSETHEWHMIDGDIVTVGITQHAADELTDITYVELAQPGTEIRAGDSFGEMESVKATSELFSAVSGVITEVNTGLSDRPELVNDDPFGEAWLVRIKVAETAPVQSLMNADEYVKSVQ